MKNFNELDLPANLLLALGSMHFDTPTPIQAQAIPLALEGKDIIGSAQTGTGKTAAFAIPIVARLINTKYDSALVLTPTRELAMQVMEVVRNLLGKNSNIETALLIGGDSYTKQFAQLRRNPRIVVGTPGRVNDHLLRNSLILDDTNFLVLDEADRMLDMGFGIQLEKIIKYLPAERQTMMFSATIPPQIMRLSEKYMYKPERISVDADNSAATKVKQEIIRTTGANKYNDLVKELDKRQGSVIIFVKTKHGADKLADKLCSENHSADAIHGDLQQNQRKRVISAFRDQRYRIMVATDVASRGLDIPHIEHVINYDLPQCPEDYIHRIGRTARANAEGSAVSLIAPEDNQKWYLISKLLNPNSVANDEFKSGGSSKRGSGGRKRFSGGNGGGGFKFKSRERRHSPR